jgi:DedD protein
MGLKSFFQRKDKDEAAAPARSRRASAPPADATEAVQQARTRARQRLVGAVVLLGIGIIGFPLLFETQPRPIPVDLPIEIPRKEGAPPLQMPAPRPQAAPKVADAKPAASAPTEIVESAADAGREVPPPASAPVVAAVPAPAASKPAKPSPLPKAVAEKPAAEAHAAATKPAAAAGDDGNRAKALLEGKAAASASDAAGRFVVQVGAFAEVTAARETRQKVEKLGLKTYTQVVETDAGKRIRVRVGPFASRDEADKAASKIKAAGLGSAVLTL